MSTPAELANHPDRWVRLEGTVNFRDLGGYPTADGRRTRWRAAYRADGLHALTEADVAELQARELRTVVDLRTTGELEAAGMDRSLVEAWHHAPLLLEVARPEEFVKTPGLLKRHYLEMLDEGQEQVRVIFTAIATAPTGSVVYHCSAGKDRTGVVTGLLLSHLGVEREVVIADYVLSALAMDALRDRLCERYPESAESIRAADAMFEANPETLIRTLEKVDRDYGGASAYLATCGVDEQQLEALRNRLLEA